VSPLFDDAQSFREMTQHLLVMRDGRKLEITEYGDRAGHPAFFFHGLIGSHHQASYISEEAGRIGIRIIAPNRPGVGRSEFIARKSALESVSDVEDMAKALGLDDFSLIGISGGTPYALAALSRLAHRVKTVTVISGMGPMRLPGALRGMDRRRRVALTVGSRLPHIARRGFQRAQDRFRADPTGLLDRLVKTWSVPDQAVFERKIVYDLFMQDLHQVFTVGVGPITLAHELALYRNYGVSPRSLPKDKQVTLWHGLSDNIVPPAMACQMALSLPNCEAHLVAGGHFVAVDIAGLIIARLRQLLDEPLEVTTDTRSQFE
jgi:pimeloyl-ACP methyl ester carboxylesterase